VDPVREKRRHHYARLKQNVDYYRVKLSLVSEFPAEGTIVYADLFRHPQYYLPQYHVFSLPRFESDNADATASIVSIQYGQIEGWRNVDVRALIPPGTKRIILFDLPPELIIADQSLMETRSKDEYSIYVISIPAILVKVEN